MTRDDVIDVLTAVAASDRRTVGQTDVQVWQAVIGDLPKDAALRAVIAHLRAKPGVWLEPGHIRERVRAEHQDQIQRDSERETPGDAKTADETRQLASEFVGGTTPPTKRLAAAKDRLQTCEGRDESMAAIQEFFEAKRDAAKPTHLHSVRNPASGTTTLGRDENESA